MIPRVAHFIFGLQEQREPFEFLHYVALESCRRVLEPEAIYLHHKHRPWGPWWDRIEPHLTLVEVDYVGEVLRADYSAGHVPRRYRYAHHSDFIRLDALLEHGGIYADIDTVFIRDFPADMFDRPFVIGSEPAVRDERTGVARESLCNALLLGEPGAEFPRAWRERMGAALNGTWSNHSGFLAEELRQTMPDAVHVEPESTFFAFPATPAGLSRLLQERHAVPSGALSVHLWAHLWWERDRRDFTDADASWCEPTFIRRSHTTLADLVRPYLDPTRVSSSDLPAPRSQRWAYLSVDDYSGYGVAARRCMAALEDSGLEVSWVPVGASDALRARDEHDIARSISPAGVVVAHMVPERFPHVRERASEAYIVGHTAWETDRVPDHWGSCLKAVDLLVAPSRFSAEALATSGVSTPIAVVPHVADTESGSRSDASPVIPDDVFVYYTIGEWTERKAVFKTIEAYLRAFTRRDRVLLVIKTSPRDLRLPPSPGAGTAGRGTTAWSVAQLLAQHRNPPPMRLIAGALLDSDIVTLHRRGNCFVSLSRGEGWGLGAFDAATHDNPVVTTGYGGQLDYLADSPYLVRFELVPVEDPTGFPSYAPDQRWAEPDLDHAASLLRDVFHHQSDAAASAATTGAWIRRRYRPSAVATAFRTSVERHMASRDRV
jgi:glycosyltransferase involved in cell wall biosynthesis